jgi:hypothetical protein
LRRPGQVEIMRNWRKGLAAAGTRAALWATCAATVACGGRVLIGSFACGDADSGATPSGAPSIDAGEYDAGAHVAGGDDASGAVACSPPSCSVVGTWQLGGAGYVCQGATCTQIIQPCTPGAIRFDGSGALSRLTSAGWESACGFATCGDRVTGAQLSNLLAANHPNDGNPAHPCGPWELFTSVQVFAPDASDLATCTLNAYAACAGDVARNEGPPSFAPWTTDVSYVRCTP